MFRVTNTGTGSSVVGHFSANTDQQGDTSHERAIYLWAAETIRDYRENRREADSSQVKSVSRSIVDSYRAQK